MLRRKTARIAASRLSAVIQLSVHFTLKRDCSPSPPPELRVVTPPSNGTLSIRSGTVRAPQAGNCRNIEAQGRVVFYQSNVGYTGPDQVTVEGKESGRADGVTIRGHHCREGSAGSSEPEEARQHGTVVSGYAGAAPNRPPEGWSGSNVKGSAAPSGAPASTDAVPSPADHR